MKEPIEIRVGICGCLNLYHGELQGRGIIIEGTRYRVKEVELPDETSHTQSLKRTRCHFFIDNGAEVKKDLSILMSANDLIRSPSGRSERLESSFCSGMASEKLWWKNGECHSSGTPLVPMGIMRIIRRTIVYTQVRKRRAWFRRMTFPAEHL